MQLPQLVNGRKEIVRQQPDLLPVCRAASCPEGRPLLLGIGVASCRAGASHVLPCCERARCRDHVEGPHANLAHNALGACAEVVLGPRRRSLRRRVTWKRAGLSLRLQDSQVPADMRGQAAWPEAHGRRVTFFQPRIGSKMHVAIEKSISNRGDLPGDHPSPRKVDTRGREAPGSARPRP